jgi:hypothetical protein
MNRLSTPLTVLTAVAAVVAAVVAASTQVDERLPLPVDAAGLSQLLGQLVDALTLPASDPAP